MASRVWESCRGEEAIRRISGKAWRIVEGQHVVSTRKLVDSADEQLVLEQLLEDRKPPLPAPGFAGLHYLLFTPFRYPPLRHGSRFSTRNEPSIWYGSARLKTAMAETAYYRLLFLEGTTATLGPLVLELTAFTARYRSSRGIDLSRPPFEAHTEALASAVDYRTTQELGSAMRAGGVEVFRYRSARDRSRGLNVGLFSPGPFPSKLPDSSEGWTAILDRRAVEFVRKDVFNRRTLRFPREQFEVDGRLPQPAP